MPHYMIQARYSTDALNAMVKNPQDREAAGRALVEAAGGKLLSFHYCFGRDDVVAIADMPNDEAMAACTLAMGASGAFSGGGTTKLMTSAEGMAAMSSAAKAAAKYKSAID